MKKCPQSTIRELNLYRWSFILAGQLFAHIAAGQGTIDGTWNYNGNQFALVQDPTQSWQSAQADVTATLGAGWALAVIPDAGTEQNVTQNLRNFAPIFSYYQAGYWLGGYQYPPNEPIANAGWTWVDGTPWNYTDWNTGEPNDSGGPGAEQFLEIWLSNSGYTSYGALGAWNDLGNYPVDVQVIAGYLAEQEPTPEPSTFALLVIGTSTLVFRRRKKAQLVRWPATCEIKQMETSAATLQ